MPRNPRADARRAAAPGGDSAAPPRRFRAGPTQEAEGPVRTLDPAWIGAVRAALLGWFGQHARALPWRGTRDPYAIWVSEVMLQQTQVATVLPYYRRWMARFPTVEALAAAPTDEVLRLWEGLGYYSRARRLQEGVQALLSAHGGALPRTAAGLRALPGVGEYTAGAIASIAFDEAVPAIDGNVVRVLSRLRALRGDPTREPARTALRRLAHALVPETAPGAWNQAVMELGATLCSPRRPRCVECPLAHHCAALGAGEAERFPELAARPTVTRLREVTLLCRARGHLLLVRPATRGERWGHLWQLPREPLGDDEQPEQALDRLLRRLGWSGAETGAEAARGASGRPGKRGEARSKAARSTAARAGIATALGRAHYTVTRYRVEQHAFAVSVTSRGAAAATTAGAPTGDTAREGERRWVRAAELADLALPAPHRRWVAGG